MNRIPAITLGPLPPVLLSQVHDRRLRRSRLQTSQPWTASSSRPGFPLRMLSSTMIGLWHPNRPLIRIPDPTLSSADSELNTPVRIRNDEGPSDATTLNIVMPPSRILPVFSIKIIFLVNDRRLLDCL